MVVLWTDGEDQGSDRRRWERYPPDGQTSVTLASGGHALDCELLDLSLGGARLRLADGLPEDYRGDHRGDDLEDDSVVLRHRVAGLFLASQSWRRGNEVGLRFRAPTQTREHALQCATVLLYGDGDAIPDLTPPHRREGGQTAG